MAIGGKLNLEGGQQDHSVSLKAPDTSLASDIILTLPSTDGTAGQVLTTDGSGILFWSSL
jgi:hypothetical protein